MKIAGLVLFKDTLEENSESHYGLLLDDDNIICLCCGGIVEPEDYEILEKFSCSHLTYVDEILKQHF